jgi:hypothetical protein
MTGTLLPAWMSWRLCRLQQVGFALPHNGLNSGCDWADNALNQRLFGLEISVKSALCDTRRSGQVIDGHAINAALKEQGQRCLRNLRGACLAIAIAGPAFTSGARCRNS